MTTLTERHSNHMSRLNGGSGDDDFCLWNWLFARHPVSEPTCTLPFAPRGAYPFVTWNASPNLFYDDDWVPVVATSSVVIMFVSSTSPTSISTSWSASSQIKIDPPSPSVQWPFIVIMSLTPRIILHLIYLLTPPFWSFFTFNSLHHIKFPKP